MAKQDGEQQKPVRDDGLAPGDTPFWRGQGYQATPATRKAELLRSGSRTGYIPGRADSPKLADMHVQDRVPYERPGFKSGVSQAGPRPLPSQAEVYRTPAPSGGSFVRHLDGRTTHEPDRPGLVEYHNSLHPEDDAEERESVRAEISNRDAIWGHRWWS
jgi:hypothetical protein